MLLETMIVVLILWCAYILPALVAFWRDHPDKISILVVTIGLGWTFVAWVICLAWAFGKSGRADHLRYGLPKD